MLALGLLSLCLPCRLHADPPETPPEHSAPLSSLASPVAPSVSLPPLKQPTLHSASAILVDAVSGQVLYEYNADVERPMASTTKIMTALLFCENAPDNVVIRASENACRVHESSLHLKIGETLKAHDLLRAILMRSANDGCVAAAEYVAGTETAFVDRMNARAAQLGALHTHYMNPHGLHDPKHYTTARDLATIARAAMQVPRIEEVVRTQKCRISRSIDHRDVTMRNHSHFIGHFPGADGIKTGWNIPAGHCYVGSATIGGWRLISVVLKSKQYVADTAALMQFGFKQFDRHVIARPGDTIAQCPVTSSAVTSVPVTVNQIVQVVTRKDATPQIEKRLQLPAAVAPINAGATLGTLDVLLDGKPVATAPLLSTEAVPVASVLQSMKRDSPWKRFMLTTTIFAVGLVSLRYGTRYGLRIASLTKSARRRRRRLAQKLRGDDSQW